MASIGIVGAGVTGLSTALAIARTHCHDITVYERNNSQAHSPDNGLLLPPNATKVLRALGLGEALAQQAIQPSAQQLRTADIGFQLSELPLGGLAKDRYGAPYVALGRLALEQLLTTALPAEVTMAWGHQCDVINAAIGSIQGSATQQVSQHDLVVLTGHNQRHSVTPLNDSESPNKQHTGPLTWQGISNVDAKTHKALGQQISQWLGPNTWLRHWPLPAAQTHAWQLVNLNEPQATHWPEAVAQTGSWHPLLQTLLAATAQATSRPLCTVPPSTEWAQGCTVLLGNAAHPLPAYSDQMSALNLEDAWVLSRMLEQQESDPCAAATEFQRYRLRRTQRVHQQACAAGSSYLLVDSRERWWRNSKLSLGSRFLPELALSRFDWLYGYDCVRGFH